MVDLALHMLPSMSSKTRKLRLRAHEILHLNFTGERALTDTRCQEQGRCFLLLVDSLIASQRSFKFRMQTCLQGWKALFELDRWKATEGCGFVFYDPHPGFVWGALGKQYTDIRCNEQRNSIHLVMEQAMRSRCGPAFDLQNTFITPYNPGTSDSLN